MTFLGIDIGYDRCGICILEHTLYSNSTEIIFAGSILTEKGLSISKRLKVLHDDLCSIKQKYNPEHMSIEKLFFNRKNPTFEKICMSKGVAMVVFQDLNVLEIEPKSMKKSICGNGNANKKDIKLVLEKLLKIELKGVLDDTLDALCLGLHHIELERLIQMQSRVKRKVALQIS